MTLEDGSNIPRNLEIEEVVACLQTDKYLSDQPNASQYPLLIAEVEEQSKSKATTRNYDFVASTYDPILSSGEGSDLLPNLRQGMVGRMIIDLGSAEDFRMFPLARACGASTLVAVDRYNHSHAYRGHPELYEAATVDGVRRALVVGDMLDVLARLPNSCACICINGIDWTIIDDDRYLQALACEMARVCIPGGLLFGVNSDVFNQYSKDMRDDDGMFFRVSHPLGLTLLAAERSKLPGRSEKSSLTIFRKEEL